MARGKNTKINNEDWQDFSQHSNGSDENMQTYLELFMKLEADKAKKKKQQEIQLLVTLKKNLELCSLNGAKAFNNEYLELEKAFDVLLNEYYEIEDNVGKLWHELLEEQEHYVALCEVKEARLEALHETRDEKHDAANRSMKSGCLEFARAIELINRNPSGSSAK